MSKNWTLLDDRGVVSVAGDAAASFLHGLVTSDIENLGVGQGRYAALLTPQGKILFDFFVYRAPSATGAAFLIDCPAKAAADLAKRLGFYRLRAKIAIADESATLCVAAFWEGGPPPLPGDYAYPDPRDDRLGFRAILPVAAAAGLATATADYERRRILLGAPKGGVDFAYADAFPHDANMDLLHGVDFEKGCYVGQEVVSRMRHRGGARKRIVKVRLAAPASTGVPIKAGGATIGALGSSSGVEALALLRVDRLAEAEAAGLPLTAEGIAVAVEERTPQ